MGHPLLLERGLNRRHYLASLSLGLRSTARKLSLTSSTLAGNKYDLMLNFTELDGRFIFQ